MAKQKPGTETVRYEVITQEETESGDLLIPIPIPLLERLGWKDGTNVEFGLDESGQLIIKKSTK